MSGFQTFQLMIWLQRPSEILKRFAMAIPRFAFLGAFPNLGDDIPRQDAIAGPELLDRGQPLIRAHNLKVPPRR